MVEEQDASEERSQGVGRVLRVRIRVSHPDGTEDVLDRRVAPGETARDEMLELLEPVATACDSEPGTRVTLTLD